MKTSIFNYVVHLDDQYSIVYNSVNKSICKFDNRYLEELNNNAVLDKHKKIFLDAGIIVEDNVNENDLIAMRHLDEVMSSVLELTIMPTENCNFRCSYCYETFKKGLMSVKSQEVFIKFIKKNLHKFTGLNINWFGGEPTIAMDVIEKLSYEMISCCKHLKIPYQAGIITNGYNLSFNNFCKLLKLKVRHFQVTLDGSREYQDRFKRTIDNKPTFDTVFQNLKEIRDKCTKNTFDLTIRTNISMDSLEDIPNIIKLYHKEFGEDKRFNFYFRPVGNWGGDRVDDISDSVFKKTDYSKVYAKLAETDLKLNYRMYYLELTKNVDICYAAVRNSYIIGSDLQIYKCSVIFDSPENQLGYIDKTGKMVIDECKMNKWILTGLMGGTITKCAYCALKSTCYNSTCISNQVRGLSDYNCPHMKESLDYLLKLLASNELYCKTYEYEEGVL